MPTLSSSSWKIHKFGGSSLADAGCFERVADILLAMKSERIGVVVSAMGGMTNQLLQTCAQAELGERYDSELGAIGQRYADTAKALVAGQLLIDLLDRWREDASDIEDLLGAIASVKSASQRSRDIVAGFGEI